MLPEMRFGNEVLPLPVYGRDVAKKAIGVQHPIFFVTAHGAVLHPDPGAIFSADAVFLVKGNLVIK